MSIDDTKNEENRRDKQMVDNKIYNVGIYTRLSKEDGTPEESVSIETQKNYLIDYVKKQGWQVTKIYVDDGYSGTNFNRPDFQRMKKDIEDGIINCVVTKDLSRLGRNYLDTGFYLEVFFPEHNIRYISVNDGVDTLNRTAMDITPFRNILNEMYATDVSVKIKSAQKTRFEQGKYMGSVAPYGYKKDPNDKNHLVIDENVSQNVRLIFDLALQGMGVERIRTYLTNNKIIKPSAYYTKIGIKGFEKGAESGEYNWTMGGVRFILRNPVYAGNISGYKRIKVSMKSKKRISKLPEEWKVVYNTHEGIVTQEEFNLVQKLITSRRRKESDRGFENVFSGVIKCADCGYAMCATSANRRKRPDIIDCIQYACNSYNMYGNKNCSSHNIEARTLFNIVIKDINNYATMALEDEKIVKKLQNQLSIVSNNEIKKYQKEMKKLDKRLGELDRLFNCLYEDKVFERITERNFEMMSDKYQKEQNEITEKLNKIKEEMHEQEKNNKGTIDFINLIQQYQGITKLDAKIVNSLIDRIEVSERYQDENGKIKQNVKIYYKFVGTLNDINYYIQELPPYLPKRTCKVCGKNYQPNSNIQRYCPECRKELKKKRGAEAKRKWREKKKAEIQATKSE